MWISKTNKGFTILEVILSLSIFAMMSSFALALMINSKKLENQYNNLNKNLSYLEGIKTIMVSSYSYNDILTLKNDNRVYISNENMDYELLKDNRSKSIFTSVEPKHVPYIYLNFEGDKVIKATLILKTENELYKTELFKGSYKRNPL
ncbi:MAG: type II secretion system protein [Solirubrobacterales bacterium]